MTQQLNDVGTAGGTQDRRRAESRLSCDRDLPILSAAAGDSSHFTSARLTDCSSLGIGLILPANIEAGQQIFARVDVDRHPTLLVYTIRYCIPMQADQFRAGARFSGYIASKFRAPLSSVVAGLAEDQKRS